MATLKRYVVYILLCTILATGINMFKPGARYYLRNYYTNVLFTVSEGEFTASKVKDQGRIEKVFNKDAAVIAFLVAGILILIDPTKPKRFRTAAIG